MAPSKLEHHLETKYPESEYNDVKNRLIEAKTHLTHFFYDWIFARIDFKGVVYIKQWGTP